MTVLFGLVKYKVNNCITFILKPGKTKGIVKNHSHIIMASSLLNMLYTEITWLFEFNFYTGKNQCVILYFVYTYITYIEN